MVVSTASDIVLLSGQKHCTSTMFGEAGRMTTPESLHEKADCFGVLQFKNRFVRIIDGERICIIPFNKLIGYHNAFK